MRKGDKRKHISDKIGNEEIKMRKRKKKKKRKEKIGE